MPEPSAERLLQMTDDLGNAYHDLPGEDEEAPRRRPKKHVLLIKAEKVVRVNATIIMQEIWCLAPIREIVPRPGLGDKSDINIALGRRILALGLHVRADTEHPPRHICNHCRSTRRGGAVGPFDGCFSHAKYEGGACTNCIYASKTDCSMEGTLSVRTTKKGVPPTYRWNYPDPSTFGGGEPSQKGRKATQNGKGKGKRAFETDSNRAGPSATRKVINHVTLGKSESAKTLTAKFDKFSTDLDALGVLAGDIADLFKTIEEEDE